MVDNGRHPTPDFEPWRNSEEARRRFERVLAELKARIETMGESRRRMTAMNYRGSLKTFIENRACVIAKYQDSERRKRHAFKVWATCHASTGALKWISVHSLPPVHPRVVKEQARRRRTHAAFAEAIGNLDRQISLARAKVVIADPTTRRDEKETAIQEATVTWL